MKRKESGRKRSWPNSTYYDGIDKPNIVKHEATDISGTKRGGIWKIKLTHFKHPKNTRHLLRALMNLRLVTSLD